jgi:hypothetical protein
MHILANLATDASAVNSALLKNPAPTPPPPPSLPPCPQLLPEPLARAIFGGLPTHSPVGTASICRVTRQGVVLLIFDQGIHLHLSSHLKLRLVAGTTEADIHFQLFPRSHGASP